MNMIIVLFHKLMIFYNLKRKIRVSPTKKEAEYIAKLSSSIMSKID